MLVYSLVITEFECGAFFEIVIIQCISAAVVPACLKDQFRLAVAIVVACIDQPSFFLSLNNAKAMPEDIALI